MATGIISALPRLLFLYFLLLKSVAILLDFYAFIFSIEKKVVPLHALK